MNKHLEKINQISRKEDVLVIGLMSGTSLDALDIVLCSFGDGEIKQLEFESKDFPELLKEKLHKYAFKEGNDLKELTILNAELGDFYAESILNSLNNWGYKADQIDLIGSHGQTVFHAPKSYGTNQTATLQIGDADHIATKTGIITISDFRQRDTARGGEGAPLSIHLDKALFQSETKDRILLNLGGIANFSFVPAGDSREMITSDIGPANTLINQAMQIFYHKEFDQNGEVAAKGKVHPALLNELMRHSFLHQDLPKTTGPEDFQMNWVQETIKKLEVDDLFSEDIISTLTEFTAQSIKQALETYVGADLIISGGGIHNAFLIQRIKSLLPELNEIPIENFGVSADAKEAILMAYLAYDQIKTGEIGLGKISTP